MYKRKRRTASLTRRSVNLSYLRHRLDKSDKSDRSSVSRLVVTSVHPPVYPVGFVAIVIAWPIIITTAFPYLKSYFICLICVL